MQNSSATGAHNSRSIWTPAFISIFCINIIMQMGLYMMNTLVPVFVKNLGGGPSIIGLVSSIFGITALAISPVSGPAYDSFSRKRLLALCTVISAGAFFTYSMATTVMVVLIARVFHGIAAGCIVPLCMLVASDTLPEEKMGTGIGTFSLAQCIASAIGPGIGLTIQKYMGFSFAFRLGGICMVLAFCLIFILHDNPNAQRKKFQISPSSMISKRALIPGGVMFFIGFAYTCIQSFLVVYAEEFSVDVSLYFSLYAVGLMFVQPTFGRLTDRFGVTRIVIWGTIVFAANFVITAFARTLPVFLIAAVICALGYGALHPCMQSLTLRCAEDGKRGAASNTYYICMNLSMFIGPIVAGWVVDTANNSGMSLAHSYATMYLTLIIPVACALIYYLFARKWLPKEIKQ